jgi:hypothetical protein
VIDRNNRHALSWSCVLLACGALAPSGARAEPTSVDQSAVTSLFEEASSEMDARSWQSACQKLEQVTRLVPQGVGARLALGECLEGWGKLASAWSQYTTAESLASKSGDADRSQEAAKKARALHPWLSTVRIHVPAEVRRIPGLTITHDGVPVAESQWSAPMPVDGGAHVVSVRAPGRRSWEKRFMAALAGDSQSVTAGAPAPEPPAEPAQDAQEETPTTPGARPWQRPTGIAAMSVGAAGVVVGAVLGGLTFAKTAESKQDGRCDAQNVCDSVGASLRNEARAFGDASTAAMIVGGALVAGGLTLVLTAPKAPGKEPTSARIELTWNGVRIGGTW